MQPQRTNNKGRRWAKVAITAVLLAGCGTMLSGCFGSQETISDRSKPISIKVNAETCKNAEVSSKGFGQTIVIPTELKQMQSMTVTEYDKFFSKWSTGTKQREIADLWAEKGRKFTDGIATIDGRYLIAMTEKFGSAGTLVDINFADGTVMKAIIADVKSSGDSNYSEYGHMSGDVCNIVEAEVESAFYQSKGNPASGNGWKDEWHQDIKSVMVYDGDVFSSSPSSSTTVTASGTSSQLVGEDNAQKVWNWFKAKGVSDEATAGILGNMAVESGVDPTSIQGGGAGPAAGICQWENYSTQSSRWKAMSDYAASKGKDWTDLTCQLEYAWSECIDCFDIYSDISFDEWCQLKDVGTATEKFEKAFERAGIPHMERRVALAMEYYERFKGTSGNAASATSDACKELNKDNTSSSSADDIYFAQSSDPWGSMPYWGTNVSEAGCGLCSYTMGIDVILGKNITPKEMLEQRGCWYGLDNSPSSTEGSVDGSSHGEWTKKTFGVIMEENSSLGADGMADELKKGGRVILLSRGGSGDVFKHLNGSWYSTAGHYVLVYKYENGNFYVKDPGYNNKNVEYSMDDMKKCLATRSYSLTLMYKG